MGLNAMISYGLIVGNKLDVPTALGVVVVCSSTLLFIFSMTAIKEKIVDSIPRCLQIAFGAGMGLFMHLNILSALKFSLLPAILSLFMVNFFDVTSATIGLVEQLDEHQQKYKKQYLKSSLIIGSISSFLAVIFGTSSAAVFIESSAGIENGASTGLASIITAMLFIPLLFFAPLVSIIPNAATSPILMVVGIMMIGHIRKVKIVNFEDFIAMVVTIVMMPLSFSIINGVVLGVLTYALLKIFLGKWHELSPIFMILVIGCCGWFFTE